jgi:hypothetical protein
LSIAQPKATIGEFAVIATRSLATLERFYFRKGDQDDQVLLAGSTTNPESGLVLSGLRNIRIISWVLWMLRQSTMTYRSAGRTSRANAWMNSSWFAPT